MSVAKKYLIVTPYFPTAISHLGIYIYDQAKTIQSLSNYDIEVVKVVGVASTEKDYTFNGIKVHIFKVIDFPFFILPGIFNIVNSKRICSFVRRRFCAQDLAIVHSHVCYPSAYLANALSKKFNIRTIAQHHGIDALQLLNGRVSIISKLQQSLLKNQSIKQLNGIDVNVSVSKLVEQGLHAYKAYNPSSEYVLYNGVDKEKFYPIENRPSDTFNIGCVANFWPIKDHISLIKAVEQMVEEGVKDVRLRLIGKGETLNSCYNYVSENNLEQYVSFEKEIDHEQLNQFYNELNVFVLPSYYEALGCVLLEAWATNTPIISIKMQGIAEVLPENELGNLLANQQDPSSLKAKIMAEYQKRRELIFDDKYDIKNTISMFLNSQIH
ncbi:MAG: glycosyltransferase family 4 protein [Bacteroidota bacterium]|nr:glycosyltransferase family 4 protein [Bacteroidota bacterium]